ncbi:MAG: nitrilase [Candidatus Hydrogenedentota bacterium]
MLHLILLASAFSQPEPAATAQPVTLALMHGVPVKWDLEANFKTFLAQLDDDDVKGADVFITPECWLDGYAAPDPESTPERLRTVAQDLDTSDYLKRVSGEAKSRGLYICFGFTSIEDGAIFNTSGLWNPDGELVGVYHKTHIQTHDKQYSLGQGIPVWESKWGPLGMMICADRRWPETVRTLRLKGARLILNPTYGFHGDMNTAIMRTRSFENQCFIAFTHPQESLVTGPKGQVILQWVGEGEAGVEACTIDLAEARDNNHLEDRRPELYGVIAEGSGEQSRGGEE